MSFLPQAIICHDPDAPSPFGFTHWLLYSIPPIIHQVAVGSSGTFIEGMNSAKQSGYTGPASPKGYGLHHYYFWLYALDTELDLKPSLQREQLLDTIADHVIEHARLVGLYER